MVEQGKLVEVTRSFSRKVNTGNYESRDFFCSYKVECRPEDAERVSQDAFDFCYDEIERDVRAFLKALHIARERATE